MASEHGPRHCQTATEAQQARIEKRREELGMNNTPSSQAAIKSVLPHDAAERKLIPLCTGVFDYFPDALAEVAKVSYAGNQQHNPGQPLHWARAKSTDFADTIARHLLERGTRDVDGMRHSAKLAWRALALLQTEIEEQEGKPISRGSKLP